MRFKKKLLVPGKHISSDGIVHATPERMRRWCDTFRKMKQVGIKIPILWGHQPNGYPVENEADFQLSMSKYVAGYIEDLFTDDKGNLWFAGDSPAVEEVDDRGNLIHWAHHADGGKRKSAISEVSAGISGWRDGKGRYWPDAVVHVAATAFPVWSGQDSFQKLATSSTSRPVLRLSTMTRAIKTPGGKSIPKGQYHELCDKANGGCSWSAEELIRLGWIEQGQTDSGKKRWVGIGPDKGKLRYQETRPGTRRSKQIQKGAQRKHFEDTDDETFKSRAEKIHRDVDLTDMEKGSVSRALKALQRSHQTPEALAKRIREKAAEYMHDYRNGSYVERKRAMKKLKGLSMMLGMVKEGAGKEKVKTEEPTKKTNQSETKEPWQMTREEYSLTLDNHPKVKKYLDQAKLLKGKDKKQMLELAERQKSSLMESHRTEVSVAIDLGRKLRPEVLNDYPHLLDSTQADRAFPDEPESGKARESREPYEMTYEEYLGDDISDESLQLAHRRAVKQALAAGKSVPPEVLADYPDLQPTTEPDQPAGKAQDSDKPPEPGFTGTDSLGREWRDGKLVPAEENGQAQEGVQGGEPEAATSKPVADLEQDDENNVRMNFSFPDGTSHQGKWLEKIDWAGDKNTPEKLKEKEVKRYLNLQAMEASKLNDGSDAARRIAGNKQRKARENAAALLRPEGRPEVAATKGNYEYAILPAIDGDGRLRYKVYFRGKGSSQGWEDMVIGWQNSYDDAADRLGQEMSREHAGLGESDIADPVASATVSKLDKDRKDKAEAERSQREMEESRRREDQAFHQRFAEEGKKLKGRKGEVKVSGVDNPIPATIIGDHFAFHRPLGINQSGWSVTHVGTGLKVSSAHNQNDAKKLIAFLQSIADWNFTDPKDVPKGIAKKLGAFLDGKKPDETQPLSTLRIKLPGERVTASDEPPPVPDWCLVSL